MTAPKPSSSRRIRRAQRYAAADLQRANDEFSNAERANGEKKYDDARRYAESAGADADVASARIRR
jgi:hypothetical protein